MLDKIKEYNKCNFHQCTLCHKEVYKYEEFIITITKGVFKRHFAHTSCFNKLLKKEKIKNEKILC